MAEADLLDEIDDLKEKLEVLNLQLDNLKDERDNQVAELEDKVEHIREKTEKEWKQRMKAVEREATEKTDNIIAELDLMRQAFTGDTGGWEVKTTKNGSIYYENVNNGEVRDEEPEVLYIANAMKRVELADTLQEELTALQKKHKELEGKKREADLTITKIKTELNSLKSIDRLWKDSAKAVHLGLTNAQAQFDAQIDQIIGGMSGIGKAGRRMTMYVPSIEKIRVMVSQLQQRIVSQEAEIMSLNGKVRALSSDLDDKNKKVERLSKGLDEEIERLTKPMRERLSEAMLLIMKEKAARAQERREIADLWPSTHMLPTLLMRYRALTESERLRRLEISRQANASMALAIEIRANVAESKMWEIKYDDYGRPFYQHMETLQTEEQEPEIINYKPPPGRDENGNAVITEDNDMSNWTMLVDHKGEVFYQKKGTGEIRYIPPNSYSKIPTGKSKEVLVGEAAQLVLLYIKEKISKHIDKMRSIKNKKESPPSIEEKRRMAKEREKAGLPPEDEVVTEEDDEDLSQYLYDIQTVELLASTVVADVDDTDPEVGRLERRAFLADAAVRKFDASLFVGPNVAEIDISESTIPQLREIVEKLATSEEKLECQLKRTRDNLRDFSFVLLSKTEEIDAEKAEERKRLREAKLADRRKRVKRDIKDVKKAATAAAITDIIDNNISNENADEVSVLPDGDDDASPPDETADEQDNINDSANNLPLPDEIVDTSNAEDNGENNADTNEIRSTTSDLTGVDEFYQDSSGDEPIFLLGDPDLEGLPISDKTDEILRTSEDLGNLALFCGFTNLRLDDVHEDATFDFTLSSTLQSNPGDSAKDDDWLTKSFFISLTKDRVDAIREATSLPYDPIVGLLNSGPLVTARLIQSASREKEVEFKPYTPSVHSIHDKLDLNHSMWKARQLMAEVLRYQFQQEAVRDAVKIRLNNFEMEFEDSVNANEKRRNSVLSMMSYQNNNQIGRVLKPAVEFCVKKVELRESSTKTWADKQSQHVRFSLGGWSARTSSKFINGVGRVIEWEIEVRAIFPQDKLLLEDFVVEVFDEDPSIDDVRCGFGSFNINFLLGSNAGKDMTYDLTLKNRRKETAGLVKLTLCADNIKQMMHDSDPRGIAHEEINMPDTKVGVVAIKTGLRDRKRKTAEDKSDEFDIKNDDNDNDNDDDNDDDNDNDDEIVETVEENDNIDDDNVNEIAESKNEVNLQEEGSIQESATVGLGSIQGSIYPLNEDDLSGIYPSLTDQQADFNKIVSDLRGDGHNFIKRMVGDITLQEVLKLGYRPNKESVKKLPNIKTATLFLLKKGEIHRDEVENYLEKVDQMYSDIEETLQKKFDQSQEKYNEIKKRWQSLQDIIEKFRNDILNNEKLLDEVRSPVSAPREVTFPPFKDVPYVLKLPTVGALDAKGKKKKQFPNAEFKTLSDKIDEGELDAKEWPFEDFWPSQAQSVKLTKSLAARNKVLDEKRAADQASRDKQIENYRGDLDNWEASERKRKGEFERQKKDSRKLYLKLEGALNKSDRLYIEYSAVELNANTFRQLLDIHNKSKGRFKVMRMKQYLENERQHKHLSQLKKRLLKALDARSRALDLPSGALNNVQFDELRNQAEVALRTLRYEIADVKQQFLDEGVRMRLMYEEEFGSCRSELSRLRLVQEIIKQRDCIEKILERNCYEVMHLLGDLDKLVLIEADKDERGLRDTVDNLGERYNPNREWDSTEVTNCKRLIALVMAKINLAEGILTSTVNIQRCLVDTLSTKWGAEYQPVRDSWVENSDYQRAQRLYQDCQQWVTMQRHKLQLKKREDDLENNELRLQLAAAGEQNQVSLHVQDSETNYVVSSASSMVNVLQVQLSTLQQESRSMQTKLESSITSLSRELQAVRERTISQALEAEDRSKILWAFINTLQRTVQSLSAKMEIVLEEREKIVISSKLMADKSRSQLRLERKHCANLLFIMHAQRGTMRQLFELSEFYRNQSDRNEKEHKNELADLRRQIFQQTFCFTRMCTDVDALFDFFASRLANLAGSRKSMNDALAKSGAAVVLSALCKSPRPKIRKYAARALGGMGWDGFVETRILIWDCVMHWKIFMTTCLSKEKEKREFQKGFEVYNATGNLDALLNIEGEVEEFIPSGNMSLRTIIKQRRQWALRAARRVEGPNVVNQRMLNVRDGIIPSLLELCIRDGAIDWEISRNAALAICIASYELQNHNDMTNDPMCVSLLVQMCYKADAEVQTHAAITIANLCHRDESAQAIFGNANAIPALLTMCKLPVVDLLEAATAALSNITCYFDPNCKRVMDSGGVSTMVRLITQSYSENLLDMDQNDEVQANAVEMLANISRYSTDTTSLFFDGPVIDALVLMCTSHNKQVKRHAPLVMGNIAQNELCRLEIGDRGGIEALFLVLEDPENTVQANSLWALCNLMWHPPNQERAGRFISEIIDFLNSSFRPVVTHAITLLANVLYYNSSNRVRFLESEGAMEKIIDIIRDSESGVDRDKTITEGALRAVLSLSYLDNVALWLGTDAECIPLFISLLRAPYISHDAMRYSLEIICNLCVHHSNRRTILDENGIDAIVNLYNDSVPYIQDLAAKIITHLEDVTPPEVLSRMKESIGLERLVTLVVDPDPLVRAVAAESIGEEIWHDQQKQKRVHEVGGIDALLSVAANGEEAIESLLPTLWSLRNLLHNNFEAQTQFGYRDGVLVSLNVFSRALTGVFAEQTEKMIEAVLALLVTCCISHERNSRRLLTVGLETLMDLADLKIESTGGTDMVVRRACRSEGVVAMAKSLLLMLGPYNYVVCKNCFKRQDLHGTTCLHCGYRLLIDVDPLSTAKALKNKDKDVVLRSASAGMQESKGGVGVKDLRLKRKPPSSAAPPDGK